MSGEYGVEVDCEVDQSNSTIMSLKFNLSFVLPPTMQLYHATPCLIYTLHRQHKPQESWLMKAFGRVAQGHLFYARTTPGNYRVIATRVIAIARRPLEFQRY